MRWEPPTSDASGHGDGFDPATWQSEAVAGTPIRELSFPGTHHAAMVDPDPESPEYYDCQTRDVYTQLRDGIRFLDVRVESRGNADETSFYGHHGTETGRSLDGEVFPEIERYLSEVDSAGSSELVLLKLSHFYDGRPVGGDEFEADDWLALADRLQRHFGDYAVDLGSMEETNELLGTTLSAFDGPRIAIFYRTLEDHASSPSLPAFAARWGTWVDSYYPDTSTSADVLAGGVRNEHTNTSELGETQWIIKAPADLYADGRATNAMLPLFASIVRNDPSINPNIVRVDYYETSNVVELCRSFSVAGIHDTAEATPLPNGRYSLHPSDSGGVLAIDGGTKADGANAVVSRWTRSRHEQFDVVANGDGTYRLAAVHSGRVLAVDDASTDDGADIVQTAWSGADHQRWYVASSAERGYCFLNANSGRLLDSERSGADVRQWHCENDPRQTWDLVRR